MTSLSTSRQSGDKPVGLSGAMTKASYAQTNLQLYAELRVAEYSVADIDCIRAAYELAMTLFTGRYRGSGKPFLTHLVGAASILASVPPASYRLRWPVRLRRLLARLEGR